MTTLDSNIKLTVQKRIVTFSIAIFLAKVTAFFITNSVGILTDALESIVNVVTGIITVYSISIALKPKDANHPFGHGKVESLSASVEGLLILLAGLYIIYEGINRLFFPTEINTLGIGIFIVAVAGVLNYLLGMYSIRTGKKHQSIALIAGGKHLQSDTYSTIGLVIGLFLLWLTKLAWIDSVIAIIFGIIIIYTGFKILKETTSNLMDETDFGVVKTITEILWKNKRENWVEIHNLKLLKYGDRYHMDCDLVVPWYLNIKEAHEESEILRAIIQKEYHEAIDFTVHMDACFPDMCHQCAKKNCKHRQFPHTNEDVWTVEIITAKKSRYAPQVHTGR